MIVVSGTLIIDPAKATLCEELTTKLVADTVKEEGNISYEYFRSPSDPGRWHVFEEWASEAAMNEHMASPHMAEFMGAAGDLGITGVDIQRYDVSEKSKLM
jgi:quinol monooxygenase YgiN